MREKPLIEGRADTRRRGPGGHGHGHGRMMPGEKARDFTGSLRKMLAFMGQFKALVFIVLAFAVGSTVFNIVGPKVLSEATTALFEGMGARLAGTGGIDFDFIARVLVATFALYVLSAACAWVQGWVMSYVSQQTCYRLRKAIAEKIDRMPFGFFDKNSNGDTLSRITNDVDTLGQSLNQGITQLVTSVTTVVGVVAMMLWINWVMTLITLVMVLCPLTLVAAVVKRSQKYFCEQQAQLGAINGQVEEVFSGSCGGEGLLQGGGGRRGVPRDEREALRIRMAIPVSLGVDEAGDGLRRKPRIRCGCHRGGVPRGRGSHHRRRHPGVHPVRQELHAAHHATCPGLQRASADGGSGGAYLRVRRDARGGARDVERPRRLRAGRRRVRSRQVRLRRERAGDRRFLGVDRRRGRRSPS